MGWFSTRYVRMVVAWHALYDKTAKLLWQVWVTIQQPHIRGPALFIFMWQSAPQPSAALFYFQTNVLGGYGGL